MFDTYDFTVPLMHQNRIQAVIWDFAAMRMAALNALKAANLTPAESMTVALKLSVDSTNLDRFTPIQLQNGNFFTNVEAKEMFSGDKNNSKTLTVNRFCAVMSPEISKYLSYHNDETWGQTKLEGVDPKFCFPHAYYIPNLTVHERKQVYAFLVHMDLIMSQAILRWRPISQKAAFYWRQKYKDNIKIQGRELFIQFNE